MARPREPIELVIAKGKKNLTKAEISERRATEVQPCLDGIEPPAYLTAAQKKRFVKLATQLQKIKIMGETDCETLSRYITAQTQYEKATKALRGMKPPKPTGDDEADMILMADYYKNEEMVAKLQDRYFKQAHTSATALGLTISSRCKLEVPVKEEEPKVNKFSKFGKAAGSA